MRLFFNSRRIFILLLIFLTTTTIVYILYVKKDRRDFIQNDYTDEVDDGRRRRLLKNTRKLSKIRLLVKQYNIRQDIHNSHLGPINQQTIVIVIQCQENVHHLKQLLDNLKKVYFINRAFLIFSHGYFSAKMNKLILKIDFAQYMQIFYPYSIQLHAEVFPGAEPISCIKGLLCENSTSRDPEAAQLKHHWWWQANQIFDHLWDLKEYNLPILFLEANNYMMTDALYVFQLLVHVKKGVCSFCEMISVAGHDPEVALYKKRKSIVILETWKHDMHSTGIGFDRRFWHRIKGSLEHFCFFNDSRWDHSLRHVGAAAAQGYIYLAAIAAPRVFRIEDSDTKVVRDKVKSIERFARSVSRDMFPQSLKMIITYEPKYNVTGTGGWSDTRDHELCMKFAKESVWFEN